jgi:hypothetical protein
VPGCTGVVTAPELPESVLVPESVLPEPDCVPVPDSLVVVPPLEAEAPEDPATYTPTEVPPAMARADSPTAAVTVRARRRPMSRVVSGVRSMVASSG